MKKSTTAFVFVILILIAYFMLDTEQGSSVFDSIFSKDLKIVDKMANSFLEDIRFKDFDAAASYHHPEDQKKVNIPKLIESLFKIKPELLDIMEYRLLETSLDSEGKRARVKFRAKVHLLNTDKFKNPEAILYFHNKDGGWYMELESSLH